MGNNYLVLVLLVALAYAAAAARSGATIVRDIDGLGQIQVSTTDSPACETKESYSCREIYTQACGTSTCSFPFVCKEEEEELCNDAVEPEPCEDDGERTCQLVEKVCGPELKCSWNEKCVTCEEEDCEEEYSCHAFDDVPKKCEPQTHYECIVRNGTNDDPGYFQGWKYEWMADHEFDRSTDKCGETTCEEGHHCAKADAENCVVDPEYEQVAYGAECGDTQCEVGYRCSSPCDDKPVADLACTTEKKPTCVELVFDDPENHPEVPEGYEECGPIWCKADSCSVSKRTDCGNADVDVDVDILDEIEDEVDEQVDELFDD